MVDILASRRFLAIYSGCLTLLFVVCAAAGFTARKQTTTFDEITVHRINIVEPDGTLRMVLSNKDSAPGIYFKNKEYPHATRQSAGMLFFDEEGTEDGGLIYGLTKDANGKISSSIVHLSFDKYMQDQTFTIDAGREHEQDYSILTMQDHGDYSVMEAIIANERISKLPENQQAAEWAKFKDSHPGDERRVVLGRAEDGSAVLRLKDGAGRDCIVMSVARDGAPTIQILNAEGKVIDELPRAALPLSSN